MKVWNIQYIFLLFVNPFILDTWGSDGSCMNYNEYISCDSFRIRLNWLPFQEYGIWRYTVPLVAVGEKSCVSHSIAEEIDGIHPEW